MRGHVAFARTLGLALLLGSGAWAQDATSFLEPSGTVNGGETVLERYLEQRDRLLVERMRRMDPIPLGGGVSLGLEALVAFEPARPQERMLGVRVRIAGSALRGRAALAYLDLREVESLVRAIDVMDELLASEPADTDAEVRHVTQDGFGIAITRSAGVTRFSIRLDAADGEGPTALTVDGGPIAALRNGLDACRHHLFQQ